MTIPSQYHVVKGMETAWPTQPLDTSACKHVTGVAATALLVHAYGTISVPVRISAERILAFFSSL